MRWLPDTFMHRDGSVRMDWIAYAAMLPFIDGAAAIAAALYAHCAVAGHPQLPEGRHVGLIVLVVSGSIAMFGAFGLYRRERLLSGTEEYARVFEACASLAVALVLVDFALASHLISRAWLLWFWPSIVVSDGFARMCARKIVGAVRRRGVFLSRIIIVGVDQRAVLFAQRLSDAGYDVLGFFDDYRPAGTCIGLRGWPVLGAAHELSRAAELGVDEVIIVPSAVSWESRRASMAPRARGRFAIKVLADRDDVLTGHISVSQRAGVPVYSLNEMRLTGSEAAVKRAFDLAMACALVSLAGPFAVPRIAARLVARRQVFDTHVLAGAGGRKIVVRTLAGKGNRVVTKLPALLAVLRGRMSVVGPVGMTEDGADTPPELWMMKPGLTSAVWATRATVDPASVTAIQLDYVRNYSIWRDLQVLWHRALALGRAGRAGDAGMAFWDLRACATQPVEQKI